jgi:hypothetical protein
MDKVSGMRRTAKDMNPVDLGRGASYSNSYDQNDSDKPPSNSQIAFISAHALVGVLAIIALAIASAIATGSLPVGSLSADNIKEGDAPVQLATTSGSIDITARNNAASVEILSGSGGFRMETDGSMNLKGNATASQSLISHAGGPGRDLTIESKFGSLVLTGGEADVADAVQIKTTSTTGGIDIDAGSGGIDISTTGQLQLNPTGLVNVNTAGGFEISSTSTTTTSTISHTGADDGNDLNIQCNAGSLNLTAGKAGNNAIKLYATSGGIFLEADGTGESGKIELNSSSTHDEAIQLYSGGGIDINASSLIDISVGGDGSNDAIKIITTNGSGADIKIMSSEDTDDFFSINTGANGATTITTVDDAANGTAAHLTFDIDGTVKYNSPIEVGNTTNGQDAIFYGNPGGDMRWVKDNNQLIIQTEAATQTNPNLILKNSNADEYGPILKFENSAGADGSNNDKCGTISFFAEDDGTPTDTEYAKIEVLAADVSENAKNGNMVFNAMFANTATEVARINPPSLQAGTFSGGFGFRFPIIDGTAGGTLLASSSGSIVTLSPGNAAAIILPTPALGLHYKFLVVGTTTNPGSISVSCSGGTDLLFGRIITRGRDISPPGDYEFNLESVDNLDNISFVGGQVTVGDYIEVYCVSTSATDDNNTWFFSAVGTNTGSFTYA